MVDLCYTLHVESESLIRQSWISWLQQRGIHQWTAAMLETSGPLQIIGAQLIYLCQPMLSTFFPEQRLIPLAHLLEDPVETQEFIRRLREDGSR